jgi:glycosyltransferase involved in cell wall biosynthesis
MIRRGDVDALVTFAYPLIDHAVGLEIVDRHPKLPWIAHFSDPGVDSPYLADQPPARLEQLRTEERAVVDRADALVFVNRHTADLVMSKYPDRNGERVFIVPHGYDADLRSHVVSRASAGDCLHIVHTGNFYGARRAEGFLRAMARLKPDGVLANKVEATFVGKMNPEDRQLAVDLGIANRVRFPGPQPYMETLQIAAAGDVLLVIDAPAAVNVFLPSKVADYFLFGKPVLGLTPADGATADVLRRCGHDVASPTDEEAIERALRDLFQRWMTGRLGERIVRREVEAFDIRKTSLELERAMLAAIDRRRQ